MKKSEVRLNRLFPLVAWVCLPIAGAMGAAPVGQYTISQDTVRDNRTGLLWQRTVPSSGYAWDPAKTTCAGLNLGGFATGWRLPTYKELLSIVDRRATNPMIDRTAFPCTPGDSFWSSTVHPNNPTFAWVVSFQSGGTYISSFGYTSPRVRCVR